MRWSFPYRRDVIDFASTVLLFHRHGSHQRWSKLEQIAGRVKPAYNFIRLVGSRWTVEASSSGKSCR